MEHTEHKISGAAGTEVFLPPLAPGSRETPQPSVHNVPGESYLPAGLSLLSSEVRSATSLWRGPVGDTGPKISGAAGTEVFPLQFSPGSQETPVFCA